MSRWPKARTRSHHASHWLWNARRPRLRYAFPEEATSITELHGRVPLHMITSVSDGYQVNAASRVICVCLI